jgi:hypothetical protein
MTNGKEYEITADEFEIFPTSKQLVFSTGDNIVAIFNSEYIGGFYEVIKRELEE